MRWHTRGYRSSKPSVLIELDELRRQVCIERAASNSLVWPQVKRKRLLEQRSCEGQAGHVGSSSLFTPLSACRALGTPLGPQLTRLPSDDLNSLASASSLRSMHGLSLSRCGLVETPPNAAGVPCSRQVLQECRAPVRQQAIAPLRPLITTKLDLDGAERAQACASRARCTFGQKLPSWPSCDCNQEDGRHLDYSICGLGAAEMAVRSCASRQALG